MSEGLKTLLEAAQYIEQQEKLKLSPQDSVSNSNQLPATVPVTGTAAATVATTLFNEESARYLVQAVYAVTTTANSQLNNHNNNNLALNDNNVTHNNNNNKNNNSNVSTRNSNICYVIGCVGGTGNGNDNHSNIQEITTTAITSVTAAVTATALAPTTTTAFQYMNNGGGNHNQQQHHRHHYDKHHHSSKVQTVVSNNENNHHHLNIKGNSISNISSSSSNSNSNSSNSNSNSSSNSQLMAANYHDYEFKMNGNGIGFGLNRSSGSASITLSPLNGRTLENNGNHQIKLFSGSSNGNGNGNGSGNGTNNSTNMLIDDVSSASPTSYLTSGTTNRQHSPLRNASGSHYIQLMNSAAVQQSTSGNGITGTSTGHVTHISSRRRTISSNSNGAGTREVHNKLEKNRRAHLKECYEALKNQLSLKDEDRRKTSNLAILGEALKCVQSFQKRNHELETEFEHLANDKINLQKRILNLKRELGYKNDADSPCIPSERENMNDTVSLSSGRGSTLYSSSSSLSNGGSNGSISSNNNTLLSSPVSAGLQTATSATTAILPVINKSDGIDRCNTDTMKNTLTTHTTKILQTHQQKQQQQQTPVHRKNLTGTTMQTVQVSTGTLSTHHQSRHSPTGNSTCLIKFGGHVGTGVSVSAESVAITGTISSNNSTSNNNNNNNNKNNNNNNSNGITLPLSLTAKNILATSMTRGSPTPLTPSASPTSSSGVSSSSSLISSSPPINGMINNCNRNNSLTVNIPNGFKFQGLNGPNLIATSTTTTTVTANLIGTTSPIASVVKSHNITNIRKKSLGITCGNGNGSLKDHHSLAVNSLNPKMFNDDGEQPAKFLKVFNANGSPSHEMTSNTNAHKVKTSSSVGGQLQKLVLSGNNNGNVVGVNSSSNRTAVGVTNNGNSINSSLTSELCRLPGGAELNILPTNGIKATTSVATAFYHPNGKLTFVNASPSPSNTSVQHHVSNITNGILLKDATSVTPLLVAAATTTSSSPTSLSTTINPTNGIHFSGNFTQLLTTASATGACVGIGVGSGVKGSSQATNNNKLITISSSTAPSSSSSSISSLSVVAAAAAAAIAAGEGKTSATKLISQNNNNSKKNINLNNINASINTSLNTLNGKVN